MDYTELARDLLYKLYRLSKFKPHKNMHESMRGEMFILQYLALQDGSVIPSDLSGEMHISSARIAAALNNLESKGLVTRSIDSSDRRRVLVELTPEGRGQAEKNMLHMQETAARMLSRLGEHDAAEYVRITGRLAELDWNAEDSE